MQRTLLLAGVVSLGAVLGVGTALAVGSAQREVPTLRPVDCASKAMSVGQPTYEAGYEGAKDSPFDQATRYLDDTGLSQSLGVRVVPVVVQDLNDVQVVALADGTNTVGQLRYSQTGSGWRLDSVATCATESGG